ncbi:MAG: DUF5671 domain-containing protein [Patescibacteria group bacterium]|nr:DUF5671 domain-containing protein [Patescibacteria group bacterium]
MAKHDSAKYAFLYLLSLVALVFMSISVGIIVFQIINKQIVDIINDYMINYNDGAMKFAISAIIVATPIYYLTSRQIYKQLFQGSLDKDAGVRKWLTYFILLVAVVVMIGFLIGTINTFLGGDLTLKFILKTLTALFISGSVFSFYLYDIRRSEVQGKKDKVVSSYAWTSLAVVLVVFVTSWFFVDTPAQTRNKKIDQEIINNFYEINSAINDRYTLNGEIPADLEILISDSGGYRLGDKSIVHPLNGQIYQYEVLAEDEYKICAEFLTSNLEDGQRDFYYSRDYRHDKGYQCFSQKAQALTDSKMPPAPVRIP